ncbi:integral membrane protein [Purpureocillium lilacinum]|uniref:Integral membrane protein n=1 Tax=Purpureocillium lilacinum TaxID=33203 RepID=A0A179GNH6_PURLI|nr:integral membrane protein [Purpureocillium lilacinum]
MADPVPDRGPTVLRVIWTLTPLALITAILRIVARLRNRKFGWDDIFMIIAMLCFLGWSITLTLYAQRGGLMHIEDVKKTGPDNVAIVLLLNWLSQPFGIVGVAAGKISVAALLLGIIRLSDLRWHRLFLWTVPITLAALIAVACSTLTFAQCSPAEALWDRRVTGKCINPKVMGGFGTFTGSFNTFADASLAIIPATIFWQLNNSTTEKVQLTIVFGLNILTSICSGIKTQYLVELANREDQTWATYDIFVWVTGELFLMIVCGSIPTLHVVLTWFRSAADSVRSRVSPYASRKSPGSSRARSSKNRGGEGAVADGVGGHDAELSDVTHMKVKTKTTIERTTHLSASESMDNLVEEKSIPDNGVRVDRMYNDIERFFGEA